MVTISRLAAPFLDRRIVTFAGVPYYPTDQGVTVQAELIFSGAEAGTIRVTYGSLIPTTGQKVRIKCGA